MKYLLRTFAILLICFITLPTLAQSAEKTLFERLGGKPAITAVISQFVDYNNSDELIGKRWDPDNVDTLKLYLTELVCQVTGGDCIYTGQHMDVAHAGLNITEEEFGRVATNLVKALDKFKVPEKEKGELMTIIGSLKGKVVGQ